MEKIWVPCGRVKLLGRGGYDPNENYVPNDMVSYDGLSYVNIKECHRIAPVKGTTSEYWQIFNENPVIASLSKPGIVVPDGTTISIDTAGGVSINQTIINTINGKAPINHLSADDRFGGGTPTALGHLKISGQYTELVGDNYTAASQGALYNSHRNLKKYTDDSIAKASEVVKYTGEIIYDEFSIYNLCKVGRIVNFRAYCGAGMGSYMSVIFPGAIPKGYRPCAVNSDGDIPVVFEEKFNIEVVIYSNGDVRVSSMAQTPTAQNMFFSYICE